MFKPLRSNVLLLASTSQEARPSGLIVTSAVGNEAVVIATGNEVKELKVGDKVRYDLTSIVKLDSYLLCREADVLCVVA